MNGRPQLWAALADLAAGNADVLMSSKLDRLSRSAVDFGNLLAQAKREGWAVVVGDLGMDTSMRLVGWSPGFWSRWRSLKVGESASAPAMRSSRWEGPARSCTGRGLSRPKPRFTWWADAPNARPIARSPTNSPSAGQLRAVVAGKCPRSSASLLGIRSSADR